MMTSSDQSTKSSVSKLSLGLLAVSILGFADATYLTVEHYVNAIPPCTLISNCEKVLTSAFATIYGIPIALLGALYYLTMIIGMVAYLDSKNSKIVRVLSWFTIVGFVTSVGLVALQLIVIKAICIFCMLSAASSTTLFVLGMLQLRKGEEVVKQ
jgi:uncharacterized membrane protein